MIISLREINTRTAEPLLEQLKVPIWLLILFSMSEALFQYYLHLRLYSYIFDILQLYRNKIILYWIQLQ